MPNSTITRKITRRTSLVDIRLLVIIGIKTYYGNTKTGSAYFYNMLKPISNQIYIFIQDCAIEERSLTTSSFTPCMVHVRQAKNGIIRTVLENISFGPTLRDDGMFFVL